MVDNIYKILDIGTYVKRVNYADNLATFIMGNLTEMPVTM